jgi:hypothetical protein
MLDFQNPWMEAYPQQNGQHGKSNVASFKQALKLFEQARSKAAFYRLKNALRRRLGRLFDLNSLSSASIRSRHYGGIRAVAIEQIHGTLGRAEDFDDQFHPLEERSRDRWVAIAMVCFQGQPLDAVRLIQVGNHYFVEDGHHRISVARALGQTVIDAEVTVWEVNGPLPWVSQSAESRTVTAGLPPESCETILTGG